jgi:hypothetical protein
MVKSLIKSLAITIGVSILLSWPVTYLGVAFYSAFGFFTVLQFIVFYFYNDYITKKIAIEEERLVLAREAELSKQGAEVICPCDRNIKCFVPIVINDRNDYTCPGCKKTVNVLVNLKTVLTTTPIVHDPLVIVDQKV